MEQVFRGSGEGTNINNYERWASMLGGSALVLFGLKRGSAAGYTLAAAGGGLLYRGATGFCNVYQMLGLSTAKGEGASVPYKTGIRVDKSVTINKSPAELYHFWRNVENLPRFMDHLKSVTRLDDKRSHWVAKAPADTTVEWDAEIINEKENELIGWRSIEGSEVDNAGSVRFEAVPGGRGTRVQVELQYVPPAGMLGAVVAKLFGEEPEQQVTEDLRRFKQLLEAQEIPTTEGQSQGGHSSKKSRKRHKKHGGEISSGEFNSPSTFGGERDSSYKSSSTYEPNKSSSNN